MPTLNKKTKLILILTLILAILGGSIFYYLQKPKLTELQKQGEIGDYILNNDFSKKPILPIQQTDTNYQLTDSLINGPTIKYANPPEELKDQPKNELNIQFPKNYQEPITIKLDEQRFITIQDNQGENYSSKLITEEIPLVIEHGAQNIEQEAESMEQGTPDIEQETQNMNHESNIMNQEIQTQSTSYLKYQSKDKRVSTYYAYQKDQSRTLKHWTIYDKQKKDQAEKEEYQFTNAKIKLNERGEVEVYYFGEQDFKNEEVKAEVDSNLMARAQRTLQKELGEDILNTNNHTPDFIIPDPYYINKNQERKTLNWEIDQDTNTLKVNFKPEKDEYPIGLDPTLQFTAPGQDSSGDTITLEPTNSQIGNAMVSGDFNDDGRTDLAVSSTYYNSYTGRVYIFYNDGTIPTIAATADVIITGEANNSYFGQSMASGDFNADGKTDLAIGANRYLSYIGRIYIFYNDGTIPAAATTADVIITGEESSYFGSAMTSGDFNADGKTDLAVGANRYLSYMGRTYIFYNDGIIPTTAAIADVIITGETTNNYFGATIISGDFNYDGMVDLAVGAYYYSSQTGRVYIFYNDGSIPSAATSADVIIAGESSITFGSSLASGDLNYDGKTDLAVGVRSYSTFTGRIYIFYNDGTIPTTAATADVIITGQTTNSSFGGSIVGGDFNYDGRVDLAVGANTYSFNTSQIYIFYNDGSIPTTAATADIIITGEATNTTLGNAMTSGDFNNDGKDDLVISATSYMNLGQVYIFYNDESISGLVSTADVTITGENSTGSGFGGSLISGDFNNDNKDDLVVGASSYSSGTGRVYIFYNDETYPSLASDADIKINGEASGNNFGSPMAIGDLNADGRDDLVVGASEYSTSRGRVYVFYNDGTIPTAASSADVKITGENVADRIAYFSPIICSDLNGDGKVDLAFNSTQNSSMKGKIYIFYNDGSYPTLAASADVKISGVNSFDGLGGYMTNVDLNNDSKFDLIANGDGNTLIFYNDGTYPATMSGADKVILGEGSLRNGDLNADGKNDLIFSANSSIKIIYNDGLIPTSLADADIIINEAFGNFLSGDFNADGKSDLVFQSGSNKLYICYFQNGQLGFTSSLAGSSTLELGQEIGLSMTSGDLNHDTKVDLVVASKIGRIYIFYNDGSIPNVSGMADVIITGDKSSDYYFGYSMITGDFNYDGRSDLVVGSYTYLSYTGRAYIFYNDGTIPTTSATADVVITGEAVDSYFSASMISGDFNYDGRVDLAVGAHGYSSYTGRTYIFYNDGTIPTTAATADVVITGEATNNYFGYAMTSGDFNYDGRVDLAVGAYGYSSSTGRTYIFYNDGSIPTTAATANVVIAGESNSQFSFSMTSGDFNYDNRIDLVVSSFDYLNYTGRVYIFYNDGSIPTTAITADAIITGENEYDSFGFKLESGDFNNDSKIDLAVGAINYDWDGEMGRAYIFYNDGTIPTTAATADVIISGENYGDSFTSSMVGADFDSDGDTDLVIGAYGYPEWNYDGRVYIFYNDGNYPSAASAADLIIDSDSYGDYFGFSMIVADFNNDSSPDLAVGSHGLNAGKGGVYLFYGDGSIPTSSDAADVIITGENYENFFGYSLSSADLNSDNQTDLIIGAKGYSTNKGRVYIIYNDGTYPSLASDADIKIDGENDSDNFGYSITTGDIIGDSKTDLIIGATGYSTNTGRTYIINNDGSIPTLASSSDTIITGENTNDNFGISLITGDFDYDMDNDLVVGSNYNSNTGRAYIFNNDGSYPNLALNSDIKIDGESTNNYFSSSFTKGDLNNDNRTDLIIGAYGYASNTGRAYIINNDGTIPTSASSADAIITGEGSNNYFSFSLATEDFNADKKADLAAGASFSGNHKSGVYVFYNYGSLPSLASNSDVKINGNNDAGYSLGVGDFDANNKIDLCVTYIDGGWDGGFMIHTVDAAGTKPDYVQNNGTVQYNGSVMIR